MIPQYYFARKICPSHVEITCDDNEVVFESQYVDDVGYVAQSQEINPEIVETPLVEVVDSS